tara:strand:- start:12082 stop:13131 length:1050 start_codon:yes stop_codon:yes gene_type:complete
VRFKTLQSTLFISLLVAATGLFAWLISGYIFPIFWAVVLTILFYPVHKKFYIATKSRAGLASLLTIGFILVVVLVPIYFSGALVASEAIALYAKFSQSSISSQNVLSQTEALLAPLAQFGLNTDMLQENVAPFIRGLSAQVGNYALDIGRATANTLIATLLMLYILFFTLRDGESIGIRIMRALPLGDEKEKILFSRFVTIVRAMFKGTFVIAIIQGVVGGILFAGVGIESAALWAFVMGLLALIPAVGPAIVWLPASLILLATGDTWQGITVLFVGFVIISLIDNILRPILVAKDTAMSDLLVLLSVLGGLSLFGISGIIIGPVITAFFLSMWELFERDYAKDLEAHG